MVNTREEAEYSGLNCRYSPTGYRNFGGSPFEKPEESTENYTNRANGEIICLVMIETRKALAILKTFSKFSGIYPNLVGAIEKGTKKFRIGMIFIKTGTVLTFLEL